MLDPKSFDIEVEDLGGKLRGVIMEKTKGFSSWFKFSENSWNLFIEVVETCGKDPSHASPFRFWEEGGGRFRLEKKNLVQLHLLCSVGFQYLEALLKW